MEEEKPEGARLTGSFVNYSMEVVENLSLLNESLRDLRWRIHRGDVRLIGDLIFLARKRTRRLQQSLDMLKDCHESRDDER
jgi:hypothetical protein